MSPLSDGSPTDIHRETAEYSDSERARPCCVWPMPQSKRRSTDKSSTSPRPAEHLDENRGAFTTLHLRGHLRGCIGYVFATQSLYRTVAETARAAAFDDPRFHPVTAEEAPELKIEISVLSPLRPIKPEEVVVGKHGLVVTQGNRRGLLLPQVPVEWNWDRETFLSQTCLKAGLAPDAWLHDAEVQAFTAEVFGEG